jgi:hypothetical protein
MPKMVTRRYRDDLEARWTVWPNGADQQEHAAGEGERMGMDARTSGGTAHTNGRRPGNVDTAVRGALPVAAPTVEPPTCGVPLVPLRPVLPAPDMLGRITSVPALRGPREPGADRGRR